MKNNLLVNCDKLFIGADGTEVAENNSLIQSDGKDVEKFCSDELLKNYGMQPIPVSEIGPKKNKWINRSN